MCQQCQRAIDKHFKKLPRPFMEHLLWGMTAFPVCDAVYFTHQIDELAAVIRPHKRGWIRRFHREAKRIDDETTRLLRELNEREDCNSMDRHDVESVYRLHEGQRGL